MNYRKSLLQKLTAVAFLFAFILVVPTVFAAGDPIAEAESNSTEQTHWTWAYQQTVAQINAAKANGLRPIKLIPNELTETVSRYHVLYVKNAGAYRVDDWTVETRTIENLGYVNSANFRNTGWRITNIAMHYDTTGGVTFKRAGTIAVKDLDLYADYQVKAFMTYNQLIQLGEDNFRIVNLDRFEANGVTYYAAVYVPNTGANYKKWAWRFNDTRAGILEVAKNINDRQYRVTDIERRANGRYDAILVESSGEVEKWYVNQTDATLKNDVLTRHGSYNGDGNIYGGARFFDMVVYKDANDATKIEVLTMENGIGNYSAIGGWNFPFAQIDEAFRRTMSRHGIPGANFALAKNGKVIFQRAYGYADLASKTPATPSNSGRTASISKTITAAAIMKLVENGTLSLGDKVFGSNGILKDIKAFNYTGYQGNDVPNLDNITVRHLLNHTGGWDRGRSGDPDVADDENSNTCDGNMQCEPTMSILPKILAHAKKQGTIPEDATQLASIDDIIRYMIKPDDKDYLPVYAPGTKDAYSNFGYTVLQKVIEVETGKSYEQYIGEMAEQMGVQFLAGRSKPGNGHPSEWTYHDDPGSNGTSYPAWSSVKISSPVPHSYRYHMKMLLGHGGWVTTPTDLVKFASKMDGTAPNPWISKTLFKSMMQRPSYVSNDDNTYFGLNWQVGEMGTANDDQFRFEHGGALTGSSSLVLKGWYHRKFSMAYLFNSRADEAEGEIKNAVEPIVGMMDEDGTLEAFAN